MLKIYISLWDPLLFLLLHKDKFIIIFLLFVNFNSFGETFFSEGTHFFPKNISEEQIHTIHHHKTGAAFATPVSCFLIPNYKSLITNPQ